MSEYITDPSDWLMISPVGDFILCIACSLLGLLACWRFLYVLRRDEQARLRRGEREGMLVKEIMTTFTIIQMIFYPQLLITKWYINAGFPLPAWTWHWFCYYRSYKFTLRTYLGFNSLVVAVMRFAYIFHNERVVEFGKERTKKMIYWLSILIPLILGVGFDSVWASKPSARQPYFSVCLKSYEMVTNSSTTEHSINITSFHSPAYAFVHEYIPTSITNIVAIIVELLGVVIFSNLLEGLIYWKLFSNIRRYK